jgi:hypothetical protein
MTTRKYSSRSQQTTLAAGITDTATSCTVVSGSALLGGATVPAGTTFTVVIDPDTALEEIVDVTVVSTNVLTITRGVENAGTGQAHSAGAAVRHMAIGRDFREANLHIEATGGYNDGTGAHTMHGIASGEGDVVGTLKTQTLTNKTLTAPTITNPSITGAGVDASIVFEGATADAHETTLTVVDPTQDNTVTIPNTTGTIVIATAVQTLTNKTMGDALNAGGFKITNLATPTLASDAVRKDFADAQVAAAATSAASAATSAASAATSASSALTSANSASASQTAAATSAASAATSASTMAASVTAAASSATAAASSATAASTSATSAAASATAAATSATSAAASATAAATSATSAAASATTAANSVATIAGYATTASNSASAAATSAASATTSASSSLTSQTAAATSATSAAASATAAATSATSAAASATAAATSATSAAASATAAAGYVVPSQTGNSGKALTTDGTTTSWSATINGTAIPATKTLVVTTDKLSALAATSSSELAGVISDETGTGALVFGTSPTLTTPVIGSATGTSLDLTVASGTTVPLTIQNNGTGNSFVVNDVASDTTPFIVDASGNVGIGTTSPTAKLDVNGSIKSDNMQTGNPVLNSAFQVWQRGTTSTTANSYSTADRWYQYRGAATASWSQVTTGLPTGFQYAIKVQRTAGQTSTDGIAINQVFETVNSIPFAGKTVTLSFYAKAGANYSPTSSALAVRGYTGTGTDQAAGTFGTWTGYAEPISGSATLTTTWTRFTFTGTFASTATQFGMVFYLFGTGTAGADDSFQMTGVQLDVGSVALPFRTYASTIQGELAACQRYYFRVNGGAAYYPLTTGGFSNQTTTILAVTPFPTEMRVAPTALEQSGTAADYGINESGGGFTCSSVPGFNAATKTSGAVQFTVASGLTIGRGGWGRNDNNSTAFLAWSAEL